EDRRGLEDHLGLEHLEDPRALEDLEDQGGLEGRADHRTSTRGFLPVGTRSNRLRVARSPLTRVRASSLLTPYRVRVRCGVLRTHSKRREPIAQTPLSVKESCAPWDWRGSSVLLRRPRGTGRRAPCQ